MSLLVILSTYVMEDGQTVTSVPHHHTVCWMKRCQPTRPKMLSLLWKFKTLVQKKGKNNRDIKEDAKEQEDRRKLCKVVGVAMESLAATSLATEMREHKKELRTLKLQRVRAVDDEEREVYDESIKDVTEHLSILKNRIEAKDKAKDADASEEEEDKEQEH